MMSSVAIVPTANGHRYLQQLCKHWSHNLEVSNSADHGTVVFPRDTRGGDWPADGLFTMVARPEALECRIHASAAEQLAGLKQAIVRHLDRFAFREGPLTFEWSDA